MATRIRRCYTRAISRIGRRVLAAVSTSKGSFTIELLAADAPLNVDNFVQLAKRGYFNGIVFHRVVPNFVVQGGDPRGDGNGGPGYQIRCEINQVPYDRGAVGMARPERYGGRNGCGPSPQRIGRRLHGIGRVVRRK